MLRYTGCGLRNVWLENGFIEKQTSHGKAVAVEDVEGLHSVLADMLARKGRLSGPEFRFLRKELELSQTALARMFGYDAQTIALWEKSKLRVPRLADRMLRLIYREHADGNVKIREIIDRENDTDRTSHDTKKLVFIDTRQGWKAKAA